MTQLKRRPTVKTPATSQVSSTTEQTSQPAQPQQPEPTAAVQTPVSEPVAQTATPTPTETPIATETELAQKRPPVGGVKMGMGAFDAAGALGKLKRTNTNVRCAQLLSTGPSN